MLRQGQLTAPELLETVISNINSNQHLNAFVTVSDEQSMRREAEQA